MEKNAMSADEEERINDLSTAKIDEITGNEMNKVAVQKMENEMTIKKLEREYLEIKRNLVYSKKMLDEARKNISAQSETKNQLLHANNALIEKFNELKKYRNEITLIDIAKRERSLQDCKDRTYECSRTLQSILEKRDYFESLTQKILDKENELNEDIRRQIEQNKELVKDREGSLLLLIKKVESQKAQIHEEKSHNSVKQAVEERNKRIIQLEADVEVLNRQFKQEIDDLQQKKLDRIKILENYKSDVRAKEVSLCNLQSQLSETEKYLLAQNENLETIKKKTRNLTCVIQEKHEDNSQLNGDFESNAVNLQSELVAINSELQKEQMAFNEAETKMQNEMEKLFTELEGKKKLQNSLENGQRDWTKAREKRIEKQKSLSQNSELENKLSSLSEEYKKQLSVLSNNTNKQIELNKKIKDLRERRDGSRKQLDNLSKIQSQKSRGLNFASSNVVKSSENNIKSSQQINPQNKSYDSYRSESDFEKVVPSSQAPKKAIQQSIDYNKLSMFNLDSSDESEEDFKIVDRTPRKPLSTAMPIYKNQDYACGLDDNEDENPASESLSQSEILFDKLMASQNPAGSTLNKKDEDVFKIPSTTYSSMRKRSTQSKKY